MACYKCNGYWVCDATQENATVDICEQVRNGPWHYVGTQTIPAGTSNVWCRPGCDAKIAKEEPDGPPPWHYAGDIPNLAAGDYKLWCQSGSAGEKCAVKVEPA